MATKMEKKEEQQPQCLLHGGQYLGEISALCFLHLPTHLSSLPLLLAGSGSEMMLYDIDSGGIMESFEIFQGIRVHGISSVFLNFIELSSSSTKITFNLAVFGERRVKLYSFCVEVEECEVSASLIMLCSLPKFTHWLLDVCFLKMSFRASLMEQSCCVAIGCSDNSVHLWDMSESRMLLKVESPERCLLYSMRLWGDDFEALRIASGTIFNEIIVWKVIPHSGRASLTTAKEENVDKDDCSEIKHLQYEAVHMCRLLGHEGSIFRIAWSVDGSKLVSASDDRSARIWTIHEESENSDNLEDVPNTVLFGHNARIWDCCIYDSLVVTAGEDCTCRVWDLDGKQLKMIKEHVGRGIWRCLYDPMSKLLITAGFDSAIKVHQLHSSLSRGLDVPSEVTEGSNRREILTTRIPNSLGYTGLADSKSEYVRCLKFTSETSLYVATNRGFLYHAKISDNGEVAWTELVRVSEEVPIVCMDLLPQCPSRISSGAEDWIAAGDGQGRMTIVRAISNEFSPKVDLSFGWFAERERQLLGIFWCKPLEHRYIYTADPRGTLKLWRLCDRVSSPSQDTTRRYDVSLVAEFISCFGLRILCLDASLEEEMLVCGDLRGNLVLFPLFNDLLLSTSSTAEKKIYPLSYFKGAHGISTVTSVTVSRLNLAQTEICSTGGDGCICHMEYDRIQKSLEFVGMRQVKELSLIQSVSSGRNYVPDFGSNNHATGFASADFIIWNLTTEAKVLQVHCGGWRRPHSCYLGDVPELKNCFTYVKDETIHVHRHWVPDIEKKIFPLNMHVQFHGRELHSLCFVTEDIKPTSKGKCNFLSTSSWIATGCEDGTVRLTRYTPGMECWSASNLLGEHVGGSAVRSICSVSKLHIISSDETHIHNGISDSEDREHQCLLFSAGAKRVLTCWLQKSRKMDNKEAGLSNLLHGSIENGRKPSFQWLSTDMPAKYTTPHYKSDSTEKVLAESTSSVNSNEDDWRYLAVTAFLVKCSGTMASVCFVAVACSDATLALRALILPYRLWFDVALLVPLSSPILALQHVVIPKYPPCKGNNQNKNVYMVIGGTTDGSIIFWDLTKSVEAFIHRLSTLRPERFKDFQKRPRTGRGSQGGRWWRSLSSKVTKRRPSTTSVAEKVGEQHNLNQQLKPLSSKSQSVATSPENGTSYQPICTTSNEPEAKTQEPLFEICEIHHIHILNSAHQSGVNCLHVSDIKDFQNRDNHSVYYLVSGGDDQALHSLIFDLSVLSESYNSEMTTSEFVISTTEPEIPKSLNSRIRVLYSQSIKSAHSSAVKGVWTDGIWVFSTGLDQRIRCWLIGEQNKLIDYAHLVISVPEPEALDARICGRSHYQISVAGRGMQIIEFSTSYGVAG